MEKPYTRHGIITEKRVIRKLGGKLTPASGSLPYAKGDGLVDCLNGDKFLIECKATMRESFSIKLKHLEKISGEAQDTAKIPAFTFSFVDGAGRPTSFSEWVAFPQWYAKQILEILNELPEA